jgi:hypothetical protein
MSESKTPKSDQIRAMREANYAEQQKAVRRCFKACVVLRIKKPMEPAPKAGVPSKAILQQLADDVKPKRGRPRKTQEGFDKAEWQRDYMRKLRAQQKDHS